MVATEIYSVTTVLWKETAFPLCRAMEKRWKRNVVSRVSSVIVVIRLPISCELNGHLMPCSSCVYGKCVEDVYVCVCACVCYYYYYFHRRSFWSSKKSSHYRYSYEREQKALVDQKWPRCSAMAYRVTTDCWSRSLAVARRPRHERATQFQADERSIRHR